jgi:hypothetical protein
LWERAAEAENTNASWAEAVEYASRARAYFRNHGQDRAAARAQVIAGGALQRWGRHGEAREQLTAAVEVLRGQPDIETVHALAELGALEAIAGSPDADRLTAEVLVLGQALDVDPDQLGGLFLARGIYLSTAERRLEAVAYFHQAVRLGTEADDNFVVGRTLVNLADALGPSRPAAAAEAARNAAGHLRRIGARDGLAWAIGNLAHSLVELGDWDAAEAELSQAIDSDGLADIEHLSCTRGYLANLRGDAATVETVLAELRDLRASEDPQDKASIDRLMAFRAMARGEPADALRHARAVMAHADALGMSHDCLRWAWPLAVRAAFELRDTAAVRDLVALLDSRPAGHVAPMLRAERDLARARLATDGDDSAPAAFEAAITSLREQSTPYHLAHGLLDHAEYLTRHGDADTAALAIDEARDIGRRLRCQPLLDRAAGTPAASASPGR